ncbi:LacI family DNA-binding transcriptional regulator [Aureimonas leprariae]|uniref:LacI family DNA-binding transcriptional regulator n=1 Tax=Plantimonas leprariae TaxID=2615207 RepID=A0A7V7PPL3_9HYPH|nr:LacI family DNA-binding transcriptional regulator [Aureimonas leprariae]KAB0679988.1 LacI family DNA-binding transcriptional regulator [Aureimonas leprariae]
MSEDGGAPTLRDVARRANVSLATADRVVNRRAGVRPVTIDRVEAAVRELGFERHAGAAALARRTGFRVAAILPRLANPFVARLAEELGEACRIEGQRRLALTLHEMEGFAPEPLARAVRHAAEAADGIVAMGLDDAEVGAAIDAAALRGVPVVTLVSDVPGSARHRYVGIDNRAAGRVAASLVGRFAARPDGRVLVVLGSRNLRDHRDRLEGFEAALGESFSGMRICGVAEGRDDVASTREAVREALDRWGAPCAIYSAGAGTSGLADALADAAIRPVVIAHELTAETRPLLEADRLDALIVQDPGHEARSAVRILMAALTGTAVNDDQERIRIEIILKDNLPK